MRVIVTTTMMMMMMIMIATDLHDDCRVNDRVPGYVSLY
jgi:hypothetical protein